MRQTALAFLLIGLAGCGSSDPGPIAPDKLPALTEAQKKQISEQDAQVAADERGTPVTGKAARAKPR